jgi:hypothetical protein
MVVYPEVTLGCGGTDEKQQQIPFGMTETAARAIAGPRHGGLAFALPAQSQVC